MKTTLQAVEIDGLTLPAPARASVRIPVDGATLPGELCIPANAGGVVLFAHGSGSSRHSPRNRFVADVIQASGTGTLLFDLLTHAEESEDAADGHLRFDIDLLARRLIAATRWISHHKATQHLGIGYFGSSTGAAAALVAAARLGCMIDAVVSRGGRTDLAGDALARVRAPALLLVGGRDERVVEFNRRSGARLAGPHQLIVIPGATHLFDEPGALAEVAALAAGWFRQHLRSRPPGPENGE